MKFLYNNVVHSAIGRPPFSIVCMKCPNHALDLVKLPKVPDLVQQLVIWQSKFKMCKQMSRISLRRIMQSTRWMHTSIDGSSYLILVMIFINKTQMQGGS